MSYRSIVVISVVVLAACGGEAEAPAAATDTTTPAATTAQAPAADAPPAMSLPRSPAPDGARAFIVSPTEGETVSSPVQVVFGSENITILKAGEQGDNSGHHHLLINAPLPDLGMPIPSSGQYLHFGGGQTETELNLEPGTYTLQLLFGDYIHVPHDPAIHSEVITITVE